MASLGFIAALNWWTQPRYKGITLSRWLQRLDGGESTLRFSSSRYGVPWISTLSPQRREAAAAVRAIGARAIPQILQMLKAKDSRFLTMVNNPRAVIHDDVLVSYAYIQKQRALYGLAVLGPAAESAVPEVANALHDPDTAHRAAWTLACMGPRGVEVLRSGIAGQDRLTAGCCINSVGINKVVSPEIQAALLERVGVDVRTGKLLAGVDEGLRRGALNILNIAGVDIPTQVTCLVATLDSTNQNLRWFAAVRLGGFGKSASNAVPSLKRALGDPDPYVRWTATNALREISPEALENQSL